MSFTVQIDSNVFPVITLMNKEEKTAAEIYAFGALLNAFKVDESINIIDAFSSPADAINNITNGFKSAKLSPYVCRIKNGEYSFNDHDYKIGKFYLKEEAIHGLLFDAIFEITDSGTTGDEAFVVLNYTYSKEDKGYPFSYSCSVKYSLSNNNCLSITTTIKNNSDVEIPVCDGWHPYFTLGGYIDELVFEMNADKMLEFNDRLVPTGNVTSYEKFNQQEIFGDTFLDNCFVLNDTIKPACILKNIKTGLQLSVQADAAYPYLQLYTPPHRTSIAIENLSAAPDAFNNKIGLKILQPSAEITFKTSYTATIKL